MELPASSSRQRQQVVELQEMEGGITSGNNHSSSKNTLAAAKLRMNHLAEKKFVPGHSRNVSDSILVKPSYSELFYYDSDLLDEGSIYRPHRLQSSAHHSYLGSSQSSLQSSVSAEIRPVAVESESSLNPRIRFAQSDLDTDHGAYNKSWSRSRIDSHNSLGDDEENCLSKQIDNTRRDAVMTLSEKREKKAELVRKESERSREETIGICKLAKYSISMSFQKFKEAVVNIIYNLQPWYSSLKLIEGNFGSGVASYFKFLRWLFVLNFVTLIISVSFLILPQILSRFFLSSYEIPDVAKNGGTYMEKGFFDISDFNGTLPPPLTAASLYQRSNPYSQNTEFGAADIFTGEGFLTATALYYGFYKSNTIELVDGYPYHMAHAYFFSMVVCYLIILITVSVSMASSYRKTYIETRGTQKNIMALKVFCGWDHSIATEEGAALNQRRLYNEIKEALNEEEFRNIRMSCISRFTNVVVQVTLNLMFLLLMGGIVFLMWDLLSRHSVQQLGDKSSGGINTMTMAIITTLIMNILPFGFSWIVKYEEYRNPRTAIYATLLRTFLLNVVVIGTIAVFWLTHLQECWETALGQEVYRLFITDFLISVLFMGIVETLSSTTRRKFSKERDPPEFDIAWNTLNLIYNETLFLIGFYFSPLLSAVIVIKLFVTFHVKKAGALYNYQAPKKSWRAAQTQTLFLILTFIALLGAFLVFGYIVFNIKPSECGPFSGSSSMYEAILQGIFQLQRDNMFWQVVMYLGKPGVIGGVLIAMAIATYILRAKAEAHTIEAHILKTMLVSETKDKAFLFKVIKQAEEMNGRKGSPAISHSSSFHTPLSERRELKNALKKRRPSNELRADLMGKSLWSQRKFFSTSQISPGWSYTQGNQVLNRTDQPSTSSGVTRNPGEIELAEMKRK